MTGSRRGPKRALRIGIAVAVAILATVAIGALTRVPYTVGDGELAAVRLTWRMQGKAVEDCRTLSEEELAALPAHMRQPEVCETYVPPYRLRVEIDGETIENILVLAGGAHENRPIYVYSELRVQPGTHDLRVEFEQESQPADAAAAERAEMAGELGDAQAGERAAGQGDELAAGDRLELRETITLESGQVALVTYDREARRLVLR